MLVSDKEREVIGSERLCILLLAAQVNFIDHEHHLKIWSAIAMYAMIQDCWVPKGNQTHLSRRGATRGRSRIYQLFHHSLSFYSIVISKMNLRLF